MYPYALIDLHCDTLTACAAADPCYNTLDDPMAVHLSLSNLPLGVRWGQCFAIFVPDGLTQAEAVDYYTRHQRSFCRQMDLFAPRVSACRTASDIEAAWRRYKTAAILTVENGAALGGQLDRVDSLARDGVRIMTLTWNGENELGSGHDTDHGLTAFGQDVIRRMEELGILVDVSHLNDPGFFDVLGTAQKPFVATHSNARAVCTHRRNLTDDQIRAMVERRCLIGLNYSDYFLRDGGGATLDDLLRHLDHFLALGAEDCLALGSDFDGTDIPPWLSSPEKAAGLYQTLLDRGYPPPLCSKLMHQNSLEFIRTNLC